MNPIHTTRAGVYWKYNVWDTNTGEPIKDMGRVFYVVDGFGDLVRINPAQATASLR